MTMGVGGSTVEVELAKMTAMRNDINPIATEEYEGRQKKAQALMRSQGMSALYLDASTSLYYFTGMRLHASERLHGAILTAEGELTYLCPAFEAEKTRAMMQMAGGLATWEEHEDPTALVIAVIQKSGLRSGAVGIDETTPFFIFDGLRRAGNSFDFVNGASVTGACRMIKSAAEIALMQAAKTITLQVHQATARILHEGITTAEVQDFITAAHMRLGADEPPGFRIVLFGEATAYPHGVPYTQRLKPGEMVLIDTGAPIEGYTSDITRSYVFGTPTQRQREIWNTEKAAQAAAFAAARVGEPCEAVDQAARRVIEAAGLGPDYKVPGLPHRTGHGIGLDVHEWSYLVKGNRMSLAPGMCFSNEPMICIYGEFGIRLEDHFDMTEDGPRWFTQPSHSIDDPFGLEA